MQALYRPDNISRCLPGYGNGVQRFCCYLVVVDFCDDIIMGLLGRSFDAADG